MAPVYDLARSRYASTLVAACFAAGLLVLAVMVASTSASLGGQLRPAASPIEGRTLVDSPIGPALPLVREAAIPGLPTTPEAPSGAASSAQPITPSTPPAPTSPVPGAPAAPTTPTAPGVGGLTVPTVPGIPAVPPVPSADDVVDELTSLLESLPSGATFGGLTP